MQKVSVDGKRRTCREEHIIPPHFPIAIPTNQSFTEHWNKWVWKKVSRHFKRNKERIPDTVQNIFLRLLAKDTIGRWFYKHLTDELVDKPEAERILGGAKLAFISQVSPRFGHRADENSLWNVRELLNFARFDYERYYYSIQGHTIDSAKVLRLLGYCELKPDGTWVVDPMSISSLESMYRQGRLKPAELTEHNCSEKFQTFRPLDGLCTVPGCEKKHMARGYCKSHYSQSRTTTCVACAEGRAKLAEKKLSLTHRWNSPESIDAAMKLRWNDRQLKDYLRDWRRTNMVKCTPLHIMRTSPTFGIDAGLLSYAERIIDNAVINDFKSLTRSDDIPNTVLNDGISPENSNAESVAWESEGDGEESYRVMRDVNSLADFHNFENRHDASKLLDMSRLTDEEFAILSIVDMSENSVREYADLHKKSIQYVHKVRNIALAKMRKKDAVDKVSDADILSISETVCSKFDLPLKEILGSATVGLPVLARTELFFALHKRGMSARSISSRFFIPIEKVQSAIFRGDRKSILEVSSPPGN